MHSEENEFEHGGYAFDTVPLIELPLNSSEIKFTFETEKSKGEREITVRDIRLKPNNMIHLPCKSGTTIKLKYDHIEVINDVLLIHNASFYTPYEFTKKGITFVTWKMYRNVRSPKYICGTIKSLTDERLSEYGTDFLNITDKIFNHVEEHQIPFFRRVELNKHEHYWKHWWKLRYSTDDEYNVTYSVDHYKAWGFIIVDEASNLTIRIDIDYASENKAITIALTEFIGESEPSYRDTRRQNYDEYNIDMNGFQITTHTPTIGMPDTIATDRSRVTIYFNDDFSFKSVEISNHNDNSFINMIEKLRKIDEFDEIISYIESIVR